MSSLTPDETLLGLLAVQARHGYDLLEAFKQPDQLGRVWNLSTSQLYAVLKRLESRGDITGREIMSGKAPTRTEYQLTPQGEARLVNWLQEPQPSASIHRVRVEFLSRLYIARLLDIPTVPIVEYQRRACLVERSNLLDDLERIEPGIGRLTLELVVAQLAVIIQWLDRCELRPKSVDER